jgi:hypothetical protein
LPCRLRSARRRGRTEIEAGHVLPAPISQRFEQTSRRADQRPRIAARELTKSHFQRDQRRADQEESR